MNLYDYSARQMDNAVTRFTSVDPHAEKYYSISPYAYVMNNPLKYIDPTGMVIDSLSRGAWDQQKNTITALRDKLNNSNGNGKNSERIASLNGTLSDMTSIENSTDVYSLVETNGNVGYLRYDVATGSLVIEYNSTGNFVHEVTHGGQYERGEIGFNTQTGFSIAQDLWDEASAYRAQFQYDPSSVGTVSKASQITPKWVQDIIDVNGNKPYAPGGTSNTGEYPLNGNSMAYSVMMAYPSLRDKIIPIALRMPAMRKYQNHKFK